MVDNLGHQPAPGKQIATALGHIYIPKGVDRNKFVESCMRRGVCSVIRNNSFGVTLNVRIGREEAQIIDWPAETGVLGSMVVLVMEPFKKIYTAVAVLDGDGQVSKTKEGIRIIEKETPNGRTTIILDGNQGKISLLSEGGDIELISRNGKVSIKSDSEINIDSDLIVHNAGEEPILRGNKTVELIDKLIGLLFEARTATSIGLQPLNNFVQINELKKDLEELKSTNSYIK